MSIGERSLSSTPSLYLLHKHIDNGGLSMMQVADECHIAHEFRVAHQCGHKLISIPDTEKM